MKCSMHHIRHQSTSAMVALLILFSLTGCDNSNQTGPAIENLAKGKAFMEQNKLKDDIITLESGIQYGIITKGSGKFPKLADVVIVHYRGKHLDGTIFSDSYKEDKPEQILVKHAILGWKKIMPLMGVGSKWTVYLPPHMAFSNRGFEDIIEPNETLIYEIELIGIAW